MPRENVGLVVDAGAVNVLYGDGIGGLSDAGDDYWYQGGTGTSLLEGGEDGEPEAAQEATPAGLAGGAPDVLALLPAAPNPFTGRTTLRFTLPEAGPVPLTVYDALGRAVAVLVNGPVEAGRHVARLDGSSLPAGTYLVRLEAGSTVETRRVTLVR